MLYLPCVCVCVCRSLLVHSFKYGQYSTWILYMHPLLWLCIESSFIILYILYIIRFFFKFLYQFLRPVTMMLETWYVTYGWGQDNILYLYSHNHIRCFAISRKNITMFIKSFPCFVKGEQYIPVTHKIHVHFAIAGLSFSEQP